MTTGTSELSKLIAIAGASCSGKSTLAAELSAALGGAAVIALDSFYRDLAHLPPALRGHENFDHPGALDFALVRECLEKLRTGRSASIPRYDFREHTRVGFRRAEPRPYVVLEGLHALYLPEIREAAALRVFVELEPELCLRRRLVRDSHERGRSDSAIRAQFAETVEPMYAQYVLPTKTWADILMRGDTPTEEAIGLVLSKL